MRCDNCTVGKCHICRWAEEFNSLECTYDQAPDGSEPTEEVRALVQKHGLNGFLGAAMDVLSTEDNRILVDGQERLLAKVTFQYV